MNKIHILNARKAISNHLYHEMFKVVENELNKIAQDLNLDGVDVVIKVQPWVVPELGIGGYAPTGYLAEIAIDVDSPKFIELWRQELPCTLAHELHHAKRWQGVGYGQTLLEALVTEGLAQHYEMLMYGKVPIYATPVGDIEQLWQQAKAELNGPYNHHAWFFGSEEKNLPRWAGYALGHELVRRFFNRNGGNATIHANTPAELFKW